MLLSVDDINKYTYSLAKGLELKWKEMIHESDHRLFYPKVYGILKGRKVVVRGFRISEEDEENPKKSWQYKTRFQIKIANPEQLFFQIEKVEDYLSFEGKEQFKLKTNNRSLFFAVLNNELQSKFLEVWDNKDCSHFHLKGNVLDLELQWVIHNEKELKQAVIILELMSGMADHLGSGNVDMK